MIHCHVSDGVCTLRLDAPPLNTLTRAMLGELCEAIRRAENDPAVRAVVLIGSTQHFSAGADIGLFEQIRTPQDATELCREFQEGFQAIEDCRKPVVAALAGNVMGGALELAMACHFRVAAADARFSLPEVRLGINPGAGGTQRLPRLVGPAAALRMLLTGDPIGADEALASGLIDAVCPAGTLVERAEEMARSGLAPARTSERTDKLPADEAIFAEAERLAAKSRPEIVAPRVILQAVRTGIEQSFEAGLLGERDGFAACIATGAAQSKIHLFFATRKAAKVPELAEVEPCPIAKAAVVGMGTMGTGIAQALLSAGLKVVVQDEDPAACKRGREKIQQSLVRRVEQGNLSRERADRMLGLLFAADPQQALGDVDLVVEAVFEDLTLKRSVFERLEEQCRPDAILASNTSTISLDDLGQCLRRPERLVGLHFFNPAQRMPLLEVIRPPAASLDTIATAMHLAKMLRKTPVLVRNRAGFIVSRLFVPYLKEAFWLLEEGAGLEAIDRAMLDFGFPMGPLALIDMAGLDILAFTDRVLRQAFPWHGDLPMLAARLVERGNLGQKTGAGVYRYEAGDHAPRPGDHTESLLAEIRQQRGIAARAVDAEEITKRLVLRMVAEAFWILEDGIAQRPSDVDVAVVLGIGFPDFRGGVVRYAEDRGLDRVRTELEKLAARCGERFAPCSRLCREGT